MDLIELDELRAQVLRMIDGTYNLTVEQSADCVIKCVLGAVLQNLSLREHPKYGAASVVRDLWPDSQTKEADNDTN